MSNLYKIKFKSQRGGHPTDVIIEAEDYDEAKSLADTFETLFGHRVINIWPFIFDIKAYIDKSMGGEVVMDSPGTFGINQERFAALQKKKEAEEKNSVPEPAKSK